MVFNWILFRISITRHYAMLDYCSNFIKCVGEFVFFFFLSRKWHLQSSTFFQFDFKMMIWIFLNLKRIWVFIIKNLQFLSRRVFLVIFTCIQSEGLPKSGHLIQFLEKTCFNLLLNLFYYNYVFFSSPYVIWSCWLR